MLQSSGGGVQTSLSGSKRSVTAGLDSHGRVLNGNTQRTRDLVEGSDEGLSLGAVPRGVKQHPLFQGWSFGQSQAPTLPDPVRSLGVELVLGWRKNIKTGQFEALEKQIVES